MGIMYANIIETKGMIFLYPIKWKGQRYVIIDLIALDLIYTAENSRTFRA